jgi:hypothetical protein
VHAPTASWCRRTPGPGLTGRGRLAVRGDASDRPGPRPVSRAGPVAGAAGGPRPGKVIADLRLRLAERWPWAGEIAAAVTRLQALPSVLPVPTATMTRKGNTRAAEPGPPGATAGRPGMATPEHRPQPNTSDQDSKVVFVRQSTAESLVRTAFLVVWPPPNVRGCRFVLARFWHKAYRGRAQGRGQLC